LPEQSEDRLDYQSILKDALRDAVRRVLAKVAEHGLPGEHYFYIAFRTDHPGVEVPSFLRERYPDEMTVVLQHQFWDLEVTPEAFSVRLTFSAARHVLRIPFAALTAFIDPSADFALRFEGSAASGAAGEAPAGGRGLKAQGAKAGGGRVAARSAAKRSSRAEPAAGHGARARGRGAEGVSNREPKTVEKPPPPVQPEKEPPASGKSGDVIRFDPSRRR
jgi:hypothetical protein